MKQVVMKVVKTDKIAAGVYKTVFGGDVSGITNAGQFVNVKIEGLYLRRPISVCDLSDNTLTLVYKVVGKGTEMLSRSTSFNVGR